jgi:hypothetical protein
MTMVAGLIIAASTCDAADQLPGWEAPAGAKGVAFRISGEQQRVHIWGRR